MITHWTAINLTVQNWAMSDVTDPRLAAVLAKTAASEVRRSLIRASLFMAGFELLKGEILDRVQQFYVFGFDENGPSRDAMYETKVRALHKKEFEACLLWLGQQDALSDVELELVRAVRAHRNQLAHELPRFILEPGADIDLPLLSKMRDLIASLGRFWGRMEVSMNPDFDGVDVDETEIRSGILVLMDHLIDAADAA